MNIIKKLFYPFAPLVTGLVIGVVVSAIALFAYVLYFLGMIRSGEWNQQTGLVRTIGEQVRTSVMQEKATAINGKAQSIQNGVITVEVNRAATGKQIMHFSYDNTTQFVRLNNDDDSTELPIYPTEIVVGDEITILTKEPIGSVDNQHAVKVVKF